MNYRRLTEDEILRLKSQSCLADDWGKVANSTVRANTLLAWSVA